MFNISLYLKCIVLPNELKAKHKITLTPANIRLDCVEINGFWKGIEPFINSKGMIKFDLIPTKGIINSPDQRRAGYKLQGWKDSINFSSLYEYYAPEYTGFGWGEPNDKKTMRVKGKDVPNPMYPFKNAGFLFIYSKDYSCIEILVIEGERHLWNGNVKALASGAMNEALQQIRATAKPFFEY